MAKLRQLKKIKKRSDVELYALVQTKLGWSLTYAHTAMPKDPGQEPGPEHQTLVFEQLHQIIDWLWLRPRVAMVIQNLETSLESFRQLPGTRKPSQTRRSQRPGQVQELGLQEFSRKGNTQALRICLSTRTPEAGQSQIPDRSMMIFDYHQFIPRANPDSVLDGLAIWLNFGHLVDQLWTIFGLDLLRRTKAPALRSPSGVGLAILRRNYLENLDIQGLYAQEDQELRPAFYGGRCEVFRPYTEKIWCYDRNSYYPWIMLSQPLPQGLPSVLVYNINPLILESNSKLRQRLFLALISFEPPSDLSIPVLAKRIGDAKDQRISYDLDPGKGVYCSPEIFQALDLGYEIQIHKIWLYPDYAGLDSRDALAPMIVKLYELRSKEDPGIRGFWKLVINSLYGRFGIDQDQARSLGWWGPGALQAPAVNDLIDLDMMEAKPQGPWPRKTKPKFRYLNVGISAFISCYARVRLQELMLKYQARGTLVYVDTDAIFLREPMDPRDQGDPKVLGGWKQIHESWDTICILRAKSYFMVSGHQPPLIKNRGLTLPCLEPQQIKNLFRLLVTEGQVSLAQIRPELQGTNACWSLNKDPSQRKWTWQHRELPEPACSRSEAWKDLVTEPRKIYNHL